MEDGLSERGLAVTISNEYEDAFDEGGEEVDGAAAERRCWE